MATRGILYGGWSCPHSLTVFLRHHNRHYLWGVFSMSLLQYFLLKGVILVNVGGFARDHVRRRVGCTYWLSNTVSINCTCARRVQQIKEPEYWALSTNGLNKFEYTLICCSPSLISSSVSLYTLQTCPMSIGSEKMYLSSLSSCE